MTDNCSHEIDAAKVLSWQVDHHDDTFMWVEFCIAGNSFKSLLLNLSSLVRKKKEFLPYSKEMGA